MVFWKHAKAWNKANKGRENIALKWLDFVAFTERGRKYKKRGRNHIIKKSSFLIENVLIFDMITRQTDKTPRQKKAVNLAISRFTGIGVLVFNPYKKEGK